MTLPGYNFFPAPLWLITTLHLVTFFLHLVAMNFMLGGAMLLLLGKFSGKWENSVVKKHIKLFPSIFSATVTLGVAPLLFLQVVYQQGVYSASITSGWLWLLVPIVAIMSYYLFYAASFSKKISKLKYLLPAFLGLLYISALYSSVFSLMEDPELVAALYAKCQLGFTVNSDYFVWVTRWLHMVSGAVVVASLFMAIFGRDDEVVCRFSRKAMMWAFTASLVTGTVYIFTLGDQIRPFMRSAAIMVLTVSIVLSILGLVFLVKRRIVPAAVTILLSMAGMVVVRHQTRILKLQETLDFDAVQVAPQWGVFFIFLVCFLMAIGVIFWMLRALAISLGKGQDS